MIYMLEGTGGVGKSLYMVSKLIPDYLKIRNADGTYCPVHIWTNIEGLKPSLILALSGLPESIGMFIHTIGECVDDNGNRFIDRRYLEWFYYNPSTIEWVQDVDPKTKSAYWHPDFNKAVYLPLNSLIILDELQNVFGSRDFDKPYTKASMPYITRHRHYGHNIFWASQNYEQVDVTFRRNTEQVWHLEKLDNFALFGGSEEFKVEKYEGKFAGNQIGVPPFAVEKIRKDSRYYKAYKSHVSEDVKEKSHTTNMWLHSKPFMVVVCIFVLMIILIIINGNPFTKMQNGKTFNSQEKRPAPVATQATLTGLAPTGGGGAVTDGVPVRDSLPCYVNSYVVHGQVKLLLQNGKSVFLTKGKNYEVCP